jgi:toxin-antitoxin system PIN domain toxin
VKLPDVNLLLYAADETSARHAAAHAWVGETLSGADTVGLAWVVLLAFVRLSTNPAVFDHPLSADQALDVVDGWLAQPCVTVIGPTDRHASLLRELLAALGTAGNLTTDAHLAALAIEHGAELFSCDSDFSRFSGLRWTDPLRSRQTARPSRGPD